jgi:hypothetical protein
MISFLRMKHWANCQTLKSLSRNYSSLRDNGMKNGISAAGGFKIPERGGIKFPTSEVNTISYDSNPVIGGTNIQNEKEVRKSQDR